MNWVQVMILAVIQGMAELLPVSSSAHVLVAEKLMGLDPTAPAMTLLLVMLHTGTMAAVIVYFWRQWRRTFFASAAEFKRFAWLAALATALTGILGEGIAKIIEHTVFRGTPHAEIEDLFGHLGILAAALAAAGVLIIVAGVAENRARAGSETVGQGQAALIGAVQGLCLPFRGFSRSGATISVGTLAGVSKRRAEAFSFALAVILTPPVVAREALRLRTAAHGGFAAAAAPSLLGAVLAFAAGLLALRWLSAWLERGRWAYFGVYCLAASGVALLLHRHGF